VLGTILPNQRNGSLRRLRVISLTMGRRGVDNMKLYETGRVCVKTTGRETGSYCVIVGEKDGSFVEITGPKHISGVRRRPCNIRHLEPLEIKIEISSGADDDAVLKALENAGLIEKFRSKVRL